MQRIVFDIKPTGIYSSQLYPYSYFSFSIGSGMILSTLAVFFRDLEYLWSVALMLVMYTCAIFYHVEDLKLGSRVWIFNFNPLYLIILNFRNAVFGKPMDMEALMISGAFSFASLLFGIIFFYKQQDKFIMNI